MEPGQDVEDGETEEKLEPDPLVAAVKVGNYSWFGISKSFFFSAIFSFLYVPEPGVK